VQADKLEDRQAQDNDLVLHTALGVAAVAAVLSQTGVDGLVFNGGSTDAADQSAASAGLSWVYDITQTITEAAAGIERVKAEALPMVGGLATDGLLSPDAEVGQCPGHLVQTHVVHPGNLQAHGVTGVLPFAHFVACSWRQHHADGGCSQLVTVSGCCRP